MKAASRMVTLFLGLAHVTTGAPAGAATGAPAIVNIVQASLAQSYAPCAGSGACAAVPLDPMDMGFQPGGSGKLKVGVSSQNAFVVSGSLRRLAAETGTILCPVLSLPVTPDSCGTEAAPCTNVERRAGPRRMLLREQRRELPDLRPCRSAGERKRAAPGLRSATREREMRGRTLRRGPVFEARYLLQLDLQLRVGRRLWHQVRRGSQAGGPLPHGRRLSIHHMCPWHLDPVRLL